VKRLELQADFFAGYFAGVRRRERPNFPAAVVALTQHHWGDTNFGSQQHHGTAEERGNAVVRGFETAYREKLGLSDAISTSLRYVARL
jgi:predicted metalloprotease